MKVTCSYCNNPAKLVTGKEIYPHRDDLSFKKYWYCKPCSAYVGCHHPSERPLGRLANAELRKAKMAAHAVFDPLWGNKNFPTRSFAYKWLANKLGINVKDCHIGMFDAETCNKVVEICKKRNWNSSSGGTL